MTIKTALATAQGLEGGRTGALAAQQASSALGAARPAFGLVFAAQEFALGEVLAGMEQVLGSIPLWAVTTRCPLMNDTETPRSVTVALAAGSEIKVRPFWLPDYAGAGKTAAQELSQAMMTEAQVVQAALLAMDGFQGNPLLLAPAFEGLPITAAGCLVDGDLQAGRTVQGVGARSCGAGGLAGLLFGGSVRMGAGWGHGWKDTGVHLKITRIRERWITSLEDDTPADVYSRWLGREPREWSYPPLNELVRLYPLGSLGEKPWLRAPLHVEVDGSFRLNVPITEGGNACLMVGDPTACLEALRTAARSARQQLGDARPFLAIALVDAGWRMLLELQPQILPHVLAEELGDVPLVGGATLGQMIRLPNTPYEVQNQQALVILLGESVR